MSRFPYLPHAPACMYGSFIARIIEEVMVPKASQRANGRQLATHLLNAHDNERVEVAHIRGAIARDLPGALDEWYAISKTTRCKKYLYSLSINPDPRQGPLTRSQYRDYIARVEKKLKLTGQPRAIVFHAKHGREHCHVVWSRIMPGALRAVQISHDRKSLQTITRQFAADHGLQLPPNMRPGGRISDNVPPVKAVLHEKHQQERTGVSKEERVREITRAWQQTDNAHTFIASLAHIGYRLARGDSVPYVVIDRFGEIHSLPRQIDGIRTKDLRARLAGFPPESLPMAADIKQQVLTQLPAPIAPQFNQNADTPWVTLKTAHDKRRAIFRQRLARLKDRHRAERRALAARQEENLERLRALRLRQTATGLTYFLCLIPGIPQLLARRHKGHDIAYLQHCRKARHRLLAAQKTEFEDFRRQIRAVMRVEKREARSLRTQLRRAFLTSRMSESFAAAAVPPSLPAIRETMPAEFKATVHDITTHNRLPQPGSIPPRRKHTPPEDSLSAVFAKAANPLPTRLRETFTRASGGGRKHVPKPAPRLELDV